MRQLNRKELLKFKSTCARLFKEFSNSLNEFENNKILLPCCALAYWFRTDCGLAIFDKLRMPAWDDRYAKLGYGDQETALNIIHKLSDDTKEFLLRCAEEHQDLCIELTKAIRASELKAAVFTDELIPENGMSGFNSTSDSISELAIELLKLDKMDTVLDLCSGANSFLLKAAENHELKRMYGVEFNVYISIIANLRAVMAEQDVECIHGNVLAQDFAHLKANKIFTEFPFGDRSWMNRDNLNDNLRESFMETKRTITGDWVFIKAALYNLSKPGRVVAVMLNNGLWNNADMEIRKSLVESKVVEAVISLPERLYTTTNVSVSIIVLSQNNKSVRMVDATEVYTKGRRQNSLEKEDIQRIISAFESDTDKSVTVPLNRIRNSEYVLNPFYYLQAPLSEKTLRDSVELGELCTINRGIQLTASELDLLETAEKTPVKYITTKDITGNKMAKQLSCLKELPEKYERFRVYNGDIVISKVTPFKIAMVRPSEKEKIVLSGNMYSLSVYANKINPVYLMLYLRSEEGLGQLTNYAKGAIVCNISLKDLQKIRIPLIPRDKQDRIAEEYLALEKDYQDIEKQLDYLKDKMEHLVEEVL